MLNDSKYLPILSLILQNLGISISRSSKTPQEISIIIYSLAPGNLHQVELTNNLF